MMYTPTPVTRRPRPPSHTRSIRNSSTNGKDREKVASTSTIGPSNNKVQTQLPLVSSPSSRYQDGTPLSTHTRRRRDMSRNELRRISASPNLELESVESNLDINDMTEETSPIRQRNIGGTPTAIPSDMSTETRSHNGQAEPSPPPPYGPSFQTLDAVEEMIAPTPLRQDSGSSRHSSMSSVAGTERIREERSRIRRATDAARVMGLEVDFGASGSESREWSMGSEDDLSEDTLRAQFMEMKRKLRRRDNELILAAEVANRALRTHEDLLAYLPSKVKARLPDLVYLFPKHPQHGRSSRSASESSAQSAPRSASRQRDVPLRQQRLPPTGRPSQVNAESDTEEVSDSAGDFETADDEPGMARDCDTRRTGRDHLQPLQPNRFSRRHLGQPAVPFQQHKTPRQAQIEALQQEEYDERILALEQALHDAQEGEENQRKLAARLRKEVDKLHRDIERVETEPLSLKVHSSANVGTPGVRGPKPDGWRPSIFNRNSQPRPIYTPSKEKDPGWVSSAYPSFPSTTVPGSTLHQEEEDEEPDLGEVSDRMRRSSADGKRQRMISPALSRASSVSNSRFENAQVQAFESVRPSRVARPSTIITSHPASVSRQSTIRGSQAAFSSERSTENITLPGDQRKLRKKLSKTSFLEPNAHVIVTPARRAQSPSPVLPQLNIEASESGSSRSSDSRASVRDKTSSTIRTIRRSPWPSPHGSVLSSMSPDGRETLDFVSSRQNSLSPAFASLSSRMASMRAFVTSALEASGSPSRPIGRTLGSELGSEYGDKPDSSLRFIEETLLFRPSPARTALSGDEDGKSVYSEGYFESPAPLPPRVSAALSSLAVALAPYASPGGEISGLPESAYHQGDTGDDGNIFDEAFAMRKIRWADSEDQTRSESVVTESVFNVSSQTQIISPTRGIKAINAKKESYKKIGISPRPRPRLSNLRHFSDGSVALAHRRISSQTVLTSKGSIRQSPRVDEVQSGRSDTGEKEEEEDDDDDDDDDGWVEPKTIPGRLVHDIICLLAMLVDLIECVVIVVYRVVLDMRYGNRESILGVNKRAKMKRFYL